jgi:hypothetical protein
MAVAMAVRHRGVAGAVVDAGQKVMHGGVGRVDRQGALGVEKGDARTEGGKGGLSGGAGHSDAVGQEDGERLCPGQRLRVAVERAE